MTKRRAKDAVLGELHEALAKTLLAKIKSGEATAGELNAAIKFLQNNGIEATTEPNSPMDQLLKALPTFEDDEEYVN